MEQRETEDKEQKTRRKGKEKEPVIEQESAKTNQQGTEKQRKKLSMLNTEQRRAHDMVERRLIERSNSERTQQSPAPNDNPRTRRNRQIDAYKRDNRDI
ncbi:hypothetical protein HYPSUDRAFT_49718 [Hypholoma sublateritium FD-334 SS-4]|uniref:Uncharacterized protein n=1 Tax=Hypholoma sublateritium (strain FD-334 SS-4) TaxID=945553 RepID=A0A0D2KGK0_HYPSF|nr:hypothetical protein HYPSUDRAFT_49718 [Hypholoma sublateritium FD-334 SS-4]